MAAELYEEIEGCPEDLSVLLNTAAIEAFRQEGIPECAVSVRIVSEEEIRYLNRTRRGIDRVTDVLSFPGISYPAGRTAGECPARVRRAYEPEAGMPYLGDCVICLPRAREQAAAFGHDLKREIGYLTVHSLFHLMGYDHIAEQDKKKMRAMEKRTLRTLRLWRDPAMTDERLYELACEAMEKSYSPYSGFRVGACILAPDGQYFPGCNFENASYGATICAERCAASNAVINGVTRFSAIAVAGSSAVAWPCGICLQVLREFGDPDMPVLVGEAGKGFTKTTLGALLPAHLDRTDLPGQED